MEAEGIEAYDYIFVNDDLGRAVKHLNYLIQDQHMRVRSQIPFLEEIRQRIQSVQGEENPEQCIRRNQTSALQPGNGRRRNTRTPRQIGLRPIFTLPQLPHPILEQRKDIRHLNQAKIHLFDFHTRILPQSIAVINDKQ